MERRELVKKEIALWLKNEPLLAQRVQAFILLSCPVSSDLADFALALTDEEKLPKIYRRIYSWKNYYENINVIIMGRILI